MPTIFGTTRTAKASGEMASSEFAKVTLGGETTLGQNVTGSYNRQIQTIFELGNPNVYWIGGHEQGTLSLGRLVGKNGFFANLTTGNCGEITPVGINIAAGTCTTGSGGLSISDAVVESVGFQMSAGELQIGETVSIRFSSLSRS